MTNEETPPNEEEKPEEEQEFEQVTVYLKEDTKREFERFLKRLELEHLVVEDATKSQEHEAFIRVAMSHPDEFVESLEEITNQNEEDTEYERKTLYFIENTKREFKRFLKRKELNEELVENASRSQEYEALAHTGMNHEDEFVETIEELAEKGVSEDNTETGENEDKNDLFQ